MHMVTPLASPNPSGTTSFKTNMNGLNPVTAAMITNYVPRPFFMMLKKIDFSDFEILALHDCKIAEAALIVWACKNTAFKGDFSEQDEGLIDKISEELMNIVITRINAVDKNLLSNEGGAQTALTQDQLVYSREVEFTEKVCERQNVPVFLRRKRKEDYQDYLERITKFLEVSS